MSDTYKSGQFENIVPFVRETPEWLILGGPADANEAQCAVKHWPNIKVIGIEPSYKLRRWQLQHNWPGSLLLPYALSNVAGKTQMRLPLDGDNPRCGSLMLDRPGDLVDVETVTINQLNQVYGPFTKAIVWLDIEGFEYEALLGASDLFDAGSILAINVEIIERRTEATADLDQLFFNRGFELAHVWNKQPGLCEDRIFVPRKGI